MKASAPGKQVFMGEWAILEMGNPGIIASINKRVHAEFAYFEGQRFGVQIDELGIKGLGGTFDGEKVVWGRELSEGEQKAVKFVRAGIEAALKYIGNNWKGFLVKTWGEETAFEINGERKKVGFGSSAASVVATVAGLLAYNGVDVKTREGKDIVFKVSTIAHYLAQGKLGSGFDVAASSYGGLFVYKRFDPEWLIGELEGKSVKEVAEMDWPWFSVEQLEVPEDFMLLIGWTGESCSTREMIKLMNIFKETNREDYKNIYQRIVTAVNEAVDAWKHKERPRLFELMLENEKALRYLTQKSKVPIETKELKLLSEIAERNGTAGKLSGAGGGDCGIAIAYDKETAEKIFTSWREAGLIPINATIDREGVKVEQ